VVEEGHAAANHSWDHPSFPLLTARARRLQIEWCQEALPAGAVRLFRPPWGHQTLGSRLDALRLGFPVVAWSVMAEDWLADDAATLADRVAARLRPGSIVVLHDALWATDAEAHRDREPTLGAVARLLDRFAGRYRFVTVPELLALGRPRYWPWFKPADLDWLRRQL
jgi:peptidoglycan/xylan/chitin deacetylase (PgdA/CDA1 family)